MVVLDEIWGEEALRMLRVVRRERGCIRLEVLDVSTGHGDKASVIGSVTLAEFRVRRLVSRLSSPEESEPRP